MIAKTRAQLDAVTSPDLLARGRRALVKELGVDGTLQFLRAMSIPVGRFDRIHKQWQALSMDEVLETARHARA